METGVVTVATKAPQFPATHASRGMHNTPMNTKCSMEVFTKRSEIAAISAAIQGDSVCMGRGVSPQTGPFDGSTVMYLVAPNNVSKLDCQNYKARLQVF